MRDSRLWAYVPATDVLLATSLGRDSADVDEGPISHGATLSLALLPTMGELSKAAALHGQGPLGISSLPAVVQELRAPAHTDGVGAMAG